MSSRRRPGWVVGAVFATLIALPILEVYLLVKVGSWLGIWPTIGLLVAGALLGTWLIRREGRKAWRALTEALGSGGVPSKELADGGLVLVGGVLLTLPGFVTDVVGLVMLLPFTRPLPRRLLTGYAERQAHRHGLGTLGSRVAPGTGEVIEGEVVTDEVGQ